MSNLSEEKIYKYLMKRKTHIFPLENEIFAIRDHTKEKIEGCIYVEGYISLDVIKRNINKQKKIEEKNVLIKRYQKELDLDFVDNNYIRKDLINKRKQRLEKENEEEADICRQAIILELENLLEGN